MTAASPRIVELALQLGQQPSSEMDIASTVQEVCAALPSLVGVTAAVVLLADQPDVAPAAVFASDKPAEWMGEVQRRAQRGPLPDAIVTGRQMTTPDLTRISPPEVAAAAAECGLTSSVVLPIQNGDQRVGALQLLGSVGLPVTGEQGDAVRIVAVTLAARLVDAYALRRTAQQRPVPVPRPSPTQRSQPLPAPQPKLQQSQPQQAQPRNSQPQRSQPLVVPLPQRAGRTGPTPAVAVDDLITAAITAVPGELPIPRRPLSGSRHAKPVDAPEPAVDAESRPEKRRRVVNGHGIDGPRPSRRNGSSHAR